MKSDFNKNWLLRFIYEADNRNYPKSVCRFFGNGKDVVDMVSGLDNLRGKCKPLAVLSESFESAMDCTFSKFAPMYETLINDCEGEKGVITFPSLKDDVDDGYIAYHIHNGTLKTWLFLAFRNKHLEVVHIPMCQYNLISLKTMIDEVEYNVEGMSIFESNDLASNEEAASDVITNVLQYLSLRKWAEVEIAEVQTQVKKQVKVKRKTRIVTENGLKYLTYDKRWFTEVCNDNEFKVRGHFRLQPYGDGTKKLIFIKEFVKHGYHRKALIEKTQGSKR